MTEELKKHMADVYSWLYWMPASDRQKIQDNINSIKAGKPPTAEPMKWLSLQQFIEKWNDPKGRDEIIVGKTFFEA